MKRSQGFIFSVGMDAPDPGSKMDVIWHLNTLFTYVGSVSISGGKLFHADNDDGLIGRYILLQSSSLLKFTEIVSTKKKSMLEPSTKFHVKKGVATENLECPASHPYAFRGGAQCCAGYRERDDSTAPDSDWPSEYYVVRTRCRPGVDRVKSKIWNWDTT